MKLLFICHENNEGDQVGPRMALNSIFNRGLLEKVLIFSYLVEEKKAGGWQAALNKLEKIIIEELPELIIFSHTGDRRFPKQFLQIIISYYGIPPVIAYDDGDCYGYLQKPIPGSVIELVKNVDNVFLVGAGNFLDRFRKMGCKNTLYLPNVANDNQFGNHWDPTQNRKYDVIMIANYVGSKIPFRTIPGVKEQRQLINQLHDAFGDHFALYGAGWKEYAFCKGPVPFTKQEMALREGWISINYGHFPKYDYYFSNRLPISLLSGVVHITNRTPGLDSMFINGKHCFFFDTIPEAIHICKALLNQPKETLIQLGQEGADYVRKNFLQDSRMERLVETMQATHFRKSLLQPHED